MKPATETRWDVESVADSESYRTFETGATRDLDADKIDPEAFLSPLVVKAYCDYMHEKRTMPDGTVREGDNWQKGIPLEAYIKSGHRHHLDWWLHHRRAGGQATEDLVTSLCALMFNVMGYLHETLRRAKFDSDGGDVPTGGV